MNITMITAGAVLPLAAGLGVAACAGGGSTVAGSLQHGSSGPSSGPCSTWVTSGGQGAYNNVENDLAQIQTDATNGVNIGQDGTNLSDDAQAAASAPAPWLTAGYVKGMQLYVQAGQLIATGAAMSAANVYFVGAKRDMSEAAPLVQASGDAEDSACAGPSSSAIPPSPATTTAPAAAPAGISCSDVSHAITTAVGDLETQDANAQEAWVTGGDSADLQTLIDDTVNASSGADQLNTDAATFNTDATSYLRDNSPELAPGWQTGYGQVTTDINAMATDCGLPTVPGGNAPANS